MKIAKLGNQINEKELAKQCAIHVVSKSFYCLASNGYDGFTKDKCKEQCDMCNPHESRT